MEHEHATKPFDEQAALVELERLLEKIQAARRERQRKGEEFDSFVRSFRRPDPDTPSVAPQAPPVEYAPPVVPPDAAAVPRESAAPPQADVPAPAAPLAPAALLAPRQPPPRARTLVYVAAIAAALAFGLFAYRWFTHEAPVTSGESTTTQPVQAPTEPEPQPAATQQPSPAAAPSPAHAVELQMRTVRPVWVRAIVDGRTQLETTVRAGEQLHFSADRSIVVRAGNGGDLLVTTGGREEPIGTAGQPITRTFGVR